MKITQNNTFQIESLLDFWHNLSGMFAHTCYISLSKSWLLDLPTPPFFFGFDNNELNILYKNTKMINITSTDKTVMAGM